MPLERRETQDWLRLVSNMSAPTDVATMGALDKYSIFRHGVATAGIWQCGKPLAKYVDLSFQNFIHL
uniref:Uncharacterized protein n=1 Tax=Mesocestoides corti TaxID=53468 RepID=A0A5K3FMZ8_MESCO